MSEPDTPLTQTDLSNLHARAQRQFAAGDYRGAHGLCLRLVEADEDHADAWFLLGMIALEHGQAGKALPLIEKAIRLGADTAECRAQQARCLVMLREPRNAIAVATRALDQAADALTLDTLGVVLTKAGDHGAAEPAFRRACERDPDNPQFRFNLASCLQILGDLDGAAAQYREAIRLKPDFCRALWSLAGVEKATPERNLLGDLLPLRERPLSAGDDLYVGHALAKTYEDLGDYDAAFRALVDGKRQRRAQIAYRIGRDRELFAAMRDVVDAAFVSREDGFRGRVDAPGVGEIRADEPIFVCGMPRTGTTLVERILSSHRDVLSMGELNQFGWLVKRAAKTPSNRVLDAETVAANERIDFARLGQAYIGSTRPRTGAERHFVDKMPLNFLYAGFIRRALPEAKIICLRRNPMDTCLSNFRQLFSTEFSYYDYAYDIEDTGRYYRLFDELIAHFRDVMPGAILEVEYEAVVADIESEARRIVEYCGLAWDPMCIEFHRNTSAVATASAAQVRQPVYRGAVARWRRYGAHLDPLKRVLGVAD
jgi:tetratricopeptide (TPR) repeat protein